LKFIVVGASGFVGRHLLAHLKSAGLEAVGTQAQSRQAGLATFDLLRDRLGDCIEKSFFDGEVHVVIAAVVSNMDRCLSDRETSYEINVGKTIQLVEDVRALHAIPVYYSTNFVFDGREGSYTDCAPYSPANEYGRQKAEVERYIRAVPGALVARLSANVGDMPHEDHLFSQWYRLITEGRPICCIEGSVISPTYVEDVARAIVLACQLGLTGVYNVANPEFFHRDELARQFCDALGEKGTEVINKPLKEFNFLDNRALKSHLDSSKFIRETGMRFTPMREVMRNFIRNTESKSCQPC
jgi:dTDP-4-dehydrorhamnose reductase